MHWQNCWVHTHYVSDFSGSQFNRETKDRVIFKKSKKRVYYFNEKSQKTWKLYTYYVSSVSSKVFNHLYHAPHKTEIPSAMLKLKNHYYITFHLSGFSRPHFENWRPSWIYFETKNTVYYASYDQWSKLDT